MNVATAPRNRLKINARKAIAYGFLGLRKVASSASRRNEATIHRIAVYPPVSSEVVLGDLVNRIAWYLPESKFSEVEIAVPVDDSFLNVSLDTLPSPKSQYRYIEQAKNIRIVPHNIKLSEFDAVLLWNKKGLLLPRVLRQLSKVDIVDPSYYYTFESYNYARLYFQTLGLKQKEQLAAISKKNFEALLANVGNHERAYLFATGPSLEKAWDFDFDGSFRIICNTIVKNQPLLQHIKPNLLFFLDEAFFFGPSCYSADFRRMMLETVEKFQCYVMVPEHLVCLLLAHHPELESRVIAIQAPGMREMSTRQLLGLIVHKPWGLLRSAPPLTSIPGHEEKFNFPTPDKPYVMRSTSVLTMGMIPVASSVSRRIFIIGADGRKPDENYYWSHNKSAQFGDLLQTLFDTHPSFVRDSVYTDMYKQYCEFFEELLSYGETQGREYYSLTPSYVPALAKRQQIINLKGGNPK